MKCDKNCMAYMDGKCCAEKCGGPLILFSHSKKGVNQDAVKKLYAFALETFEEKFDCKNPKEAIK